MTKKQMWYTGIGLVLLLFFRKPLMKYMYIVTAGISGLGSIGQEQQENAKLIAQAFEKYGDGDRRKLYYILATAWHESWLKPIKEYKANSWTSLWINQQSKYWDTGYYGRGFVQLTWQENYQKMSNWLGIDLVGNPDLALEPYTASEIIVYGMMNGSFTGKKLSDYINDQGADYWNARRIVNGTDKASLIQGYAQNIEGSSEAHFA